MRIGFDISQVSEKPSGCGFFAKSLLNSLMNEKKQQYYVLFKDFGDFWFNQEQKPVKQNIKPNVEMGTVFDSKESCSLFWNQDHLHQKLGRLDLLHSNNFWCPNQHMPIRFIYTFYDMSFLDHPEWTTEENRIGCFNGVFRSSLYADFVVAISESSRLRYLEYFPYFPSERTGVVYPNSRFESMTLEKGHKITIPSIQPGEYWLNVSTIEPRKNQILLLDAYQAYLLHSQRKLPLVLAGGTGWLMDDFSVQIKKRDLEDLVFVTGYVTDDELIWFYRNCFANLYPALYEGFGLPVLEGMQFGAPTICSNTTSLPEVAGKAALQLDPLKPEEWTKWMLELEQNESLRQEYARRGPQQASKFSGKTTVQQCCEIYERVLSMGKRSNSDNKVVARKP
jgi:glycosyltransferase involved in cell wall biosynthesis